MIILSKLLMQKKEEIAVRKNKKFMSRNVTEFRHLMESSNLTEKDLDWVINLRGTDNRITHKSQALGPPQVYFKKTKAFEMKSAKNSKERTAKIVANQYDQIYLKNAEKGHHTQDQIQFYSSLRNSRSINKINNSTSQKSFTAIPFKDRKQRPQFIRKQHILSAKPLTSHQMQDGLDGAHRQQPYTENILQTKNSAFLETFTKVRGRNQVSLPSLAWQVGLRSYR